MVDLLNHLELEAAPMRKSEMVRGIAMIVAALSTLARVAPSPATRSEGERAFTPLDAAAFPHGQPRILALGESSHASEDMLRARNRLILQLAEEGTIRWVALETGYAEARLLDRFVRGSTGEAGDIAKRGFTSGFGNFAGNIALLQALQTANAGRREQDRVGIVGIDLSLGGPLDSAPTMAPVQCALQGVRDRTRRDALGTAFVDALKPGLATPTVSDEQKAAFRRLANRLGSSLSSTASLEARTCARVVRQSAAVFDAVPKVVTPGSIPADAWISVSRRDEAMAANALDVFGRSGGKSVLLFAHTSHVLKSPRRGGQWRNQERPPTSMGEVLRHKLGKRYFVVAQVEPSSVQRTPEPDLVAALQAKCSRPCIVPTESRSTSGAKKYRIGINGNDVQLIDAAAANAFLIIPSH